MSLIGADLKKVKTLSAGLFCYILFGVPTWSLAEGSAQPEPEVLYTSLSGALRIEKITEPSKDGEPATSVWVVSTKNPTQRAEIPKESSDPVLDDDEFNGSPYEKLDQQLNATYAAVLAKTQKEYVSDVREAQRRWIKRRDEGVKIYVSLFPDAEREQRRLQFVGDVTAARIEVQPDAWIYD
jgi:uncharacterized protein YecT (DUF1311 family)